MIDFLSCLLKVLSSKRKDTAPPDMRKGEINYKNSKKPWVSIFFYFRAKILTFNDEIGPERLRSLV